MSTAINKEESRALLDRMPENATWADLMREIFVRQVIEEGLANSDAGRTKDVLEIRRRYGLPT
jgi:predicted transcriptional regulator